MSRRRRHRKPSSDSLVLFSTSRHSTHSHSYVKMRVGSLSVLRLSVGLIMHDSNGDHVLTNRILTPKEVSVSCYRFMHEVKTMIPLYEGQPKLLVA